MNRKLFRCASYAAFVCVIALFVSCEKDPFRKQGTVSRIVPVVKSVETRASQEDAGLPGKLVSERVVSSADGFDLIEMVYENDVQVSGNDCGTTRGSVVTTGTISSFNIDAYAEGQWHDNTISDGDPGSLDQPNAAGPYFMASCAKNGTGWDLVKTDGPARAGAGGELYWLNNVPMTFWSWNVVKPVWNSSTSQATFNYTVNSDVSKQQDPIFAYSREVRKYHDDGNDYGKLQSQSSTSGASDENVNIWFYHALSAVQFIQNSPLDAPDYRISNIEIQNVKNSTTCTISADNNKVAAAGSPNISFSHNLTGSSTVNFSQDYSANDPSLVEPADYATNPNKRFKPDDGKTFIMIPQTLGTDSKLKVTFKNTETTAQETTSPVFSINTTWEAGYFYVYKVDLKGAIKVSISEICDNTSKSNVKFNNTSSLNEYIRAAVIGNWYDASGNIVAPWTGSITPGSGWTTSNGFYYHDDPVKTGEFTNTLISTFPKPATAPVTGAHFEMTILVQAVCSDGFTSCTAAFQ